MRHRSTRRGLLALVAIVGLAAPVGLGSLPAASAAKTYDGPDVASYQHPNPTHRHPYGQPINWTQVRNAGKEFAIVKATEGLNYTNPYFDGPRSHDYDDAAAAGLVHGAYHFARPAFPIVSTAQAQARYFAKVIGPVTTDDTLPPALDLEVSGGLNPPQLVAWTQAFLLELRHLTGRTPVLYTYPSFWTTNLANPKALARYPLWMASYGVSQEPDADLWQYTSSAQVKGIAGRVDMSKFVGNGRFSWAMLSDGTMQTPWVPAAPAAPQSAAATIEGTTATVTWRPGDSGTSRVTSYVVRASPGGRTETVNGTDFAASIANLPTTSSFTFTVTAVNKVGHGVPSKPTNAVTPTVPSRLKVTAPDTLLFGDELPVAVRLLRADTKQALAGRTVRVLRRHSANAPWHRIEKLTTDSSGRVSAALRPHRSGGLKIVFRGAKGIDRAAAFRYYTVHPAVTAALSAPTVAHGGTVTLAGEVKPFEVGQVVTRQRKMDGVWRSRGATKVTQDGTFEFTLVPKYAGKYIYRLVTAPTDRRGSGRSARVVLTAT